jgi:hypothetical protein
LKVLKDSLSFLPPAGFWLQFAGPDHGKEWSQNNSNGDQHSIDSLLLTGKVLKQASGVVLVGDAGVGG